MLRWWRTASSVKRVNDCSQAGTVIAGLLVAVAGLGLVDETWTAYAGVATAFAAAWGWIIARQAAHFDAPRQLTAI